MAEENNPNIPEQISWTSDSKKAKKYRGGTMVSSSLESNALNFAPQGLYKSGGVRSDAFAIPSDISGGPIDISFGSNGLKTAFASIPSITNDAKPQEPLIQVVQASDEVDANEVKMADVGSAPRYDGFQPHYAHRSDTMKPNAMQQTLKSILTSLEQNGCIDFYEKSDFVYVGRAFGDYNDCEFLLSIFTDDREDAQCIIEIRRCSGESFEYANIENTILQQLVSNGALNDDNEDETEDVTLGETLFGFAALPSLDSMDLDSTLSGTDVDFDDDDDDQKSKYNDNAMDLERATKLWKDAVDSQSMRDVLRSDVAYLNEQMAKNGDTFKQIPNIISSFVDVMSDGFYDCWVIKMYLGMISNLISNSASIPSSLSSSIEDIKTKWCHVVVNEVAPGVKFEFYPSQQIVRCCNMILNQLQSKSK